MVTAVTDSKGREERERETEREREKRSACLSSSSPFITMFVFRQSKKLKRSEEASLFAACID
jgi:hypothetical protein